jgi:thioredoxin reductase (NADPH)
LNQNYLGFPKGIKAHELVDKGKVQAESFGAEFKSDFILHINKKQKKLKNKTIPLFVLKGVEGSYTSRALIIATGVKDIFPSFEGAEQCIGKSIFWCMMCDAWKTRGKKVLVMGVDDHAAKTCLKLLNYSKDISFLIHCGEGQEEISEQVMKLLKMKKIPIYTDTIASVRHKNGVLKDIHLSSGKIIQADVIFSKLGYAIQNDLALELKAKIHSKGFIETDIDQRTNVPFVYAAGDITNDTSHQIVTAAHQGAVAAASVDEDLLEDWQK